jgi:hypothetical protein
MPSVPYPFHVGPDPLFTSGSATAPSGGANISGTLTPGSGSWMIFVRAVVGGGAPAAADQGNLQLMKNAAVVTKLAVPAQATPNGTTLLGPYRVTLAAGDTISVQSVGAGTASVVYAVELECGPAQ